ncbi:MAG: NitT/TauT family transport system substrate-binding protein [Chloroflexota bacterium]|jgi:NitT/TauT family transport system substrate-binding protein|nr:NitT/TauT family transport system substrate-binding protein [Chloroflexota bacterium]
MGFSRKGSALALGVLLLMVAACNGGSAPSASSAALTPVKFQLQWVAQSQFAGYYAAIDQGYYKDVGLDVSLLLGGPNVNNVQVVATGGADIGTAWLPNMLQSREGGTDLVSIAQIFQRSGTRMASFKAASITSPATMAGKKIGSWLGGNEPELFAGLTKAGLDPTKQNIIKQNFDMSGLLKGDLDVAQAMIYNEYAQVLEANNPATGKLYQPTDLNVVDFNDPAVGTAMLQDQIFASDKWLKTGSNTDVATKFLQASFKGWIYCRDNPQKCVDIVLAKGSQLGASHQAWQMNEINALIWPSPGGIGLLDKTLYDQTIKIATTYNVLKAAPSADATRTDLAQKALDALGTSVDTKGASFVKATITLKAGGN